MDIPESTRNVEGESSFSRRIMRDMGKVLVGLLCNGYLLAEWYRDCRRQRQQKSWPR